MRRAERNFSQKNEQEDLSTALTAKKKIAATVLALGAGVGALTGCGSSEEGSSSSSGGSVIENVFSGGDEEVIYGAECVQRDDIYALGTYSWDGVNEASTPYVDLEAMKETIAIPDGVGGLSRGTAGTLIDLDTLSDSQNKQLWDSYQGSMSEANVYSGDKQSGGVALFGDKGRIDEYGNEGYPESESDGVVDSTNLKVCVIGNSLMSNVDSDNFISNNR